MKSRIAFLAAAALALAGTWPAYAREAPPRACQEALRMRELNVSAVQFPVEGNQTVEAFLAKASAYVDRARAAGSDLIVFPELMMLDLLSTTSGVPDPLQLDRIAREVTPRLFEEFARMSRESGLAILAGSSPRIRAWDGGIVNTAFLVFPNGRAILQDKIFLTPDEVAWGWRPGTELNVFEAPWGRSAILTCYDCEFPWVSSEVASHFPEVLLVPSMTGDRSGFNRVRFSAHTRAVEHHAYVIHTGTVGARSQEHEYYGQASLLGPQDAGFPTVIAEGQAGAPDLLSGTLDLARLRDSRARAGIYPAREQVLRQAPFRVVDLGYR